MAASDDEPRILVTIPISHFCEKARWALDRAGVDYTEKRHIQLMHWAAVKRAGGGMTAPVSARGGGAAPRAPAGGGGVASTPSSPPPPAAMRPGTSPACHAGSGGC